MKKPVKSHFKDITIYIEEIEIPDFYYLNPVSNKCFKINLHYNIVLFNNVVAVDEIYSELLLYTMMFEEPSEFIEVLIGSFGLF